MARRDEGAALPGRQKPISQVSEDYWSKQSLIYDNNPSVYPVSIQPELSPDCRFGMSSVAFSSICVCVCWAGGLRPNIQHLSSEVLFLMQLLTHSNELSDELTTEQWTVRLCVRNCLTHFEFRKKNTILLWQLLHGFLVVQAKYFIFLALHLILPLGKQRPLIKWKPNIHTNLSWEPFS